MTQTLTRLNVNAVISSASLISCEIYGFMDHLIVNCQIGSPSAKDTSDQVSYVNSFNFRTINDSFFNTYNLG